MGCLRFSLILAASLAAGCSPGVPALTLAERSGLGAALSLVVAGRVDVSPAPSPGPAPSPAGDVCDECNGVGKLGDGTVMVTCPICNGTGKKSGAMVPVVEAKPEPRPSPVRMSNTRWTVGRSRNYTAAQLAQHLLEDHRFDPAGYTMSELQAAHDNIHNGYPAMGSQRSASSAPVRSSCPNGRCPTR